MESDVPTLIFTLGLAILTQVIAPFIQYRVSRAVRGIGWWLPDSAFNPIPVSAFIVPAITSTLASAGTGQC